MAGKNQVTVTFAGEEKPLTDSFDRVGRSAKTMGEDVGKSAHEGFARAGEAADEVDTKAMGFRDTLTGVQDTAGGVSKIMKGDLFDGFLTLGAGVGDLGSGFYNLLIPALEKTKVATLASSVASKAAAVGTNVWNVAQKALTVSFWLSPLGIIIGLVTVLTVAIVLIATKTDWFQKLWKVAWSGIKTAASNTWDFIKRIPGWIGTAFSKIGSVISAPFRTAFNLISDAWNHTVGGLHFTVPGWVPGIGGNSFGVPNLPHFAAGGTVPGYPGEAVPIMAHAGETVSVPGSRGGDLVHVQVRIDRDTLFDIIAKGERRGGPKFA